MGVHNGESHRWTGAGISPFMGDYSEGAPNGSSQLKAQMPSAARKRTMPSRRRLRRADDEKQRKGDAPPSTG